MSLVTRSAAFASFYASARAVVHAPHIPRRTVSVNYGKDRDTWVYKHHIPDPPAGTRAAKAYDAYKKEKGLPRDQNIPFEQVQVVDPETGKLGELESLRDLLERVPRKQTVVQLVAKDKPIVRLLDRREELQKAKEARERERSTAIKKRRSVQFTWGISAADYDHKISKALEELEDRSPIDVVISYKRGQTVDQDARDALIRTTVSRLSGLAIYRKTSHTPGRTVLEFDLNPLALKK